MVKKIEKIMTLCCAALLVVIATVSGTLAYESYVQANWESTGNKKVTVKLVQQQRVLDESGDSVGLGTYVNGKTLVPLVASAQYDGSNFDQYGMPMAEGYVDQIIRVRNEGTVYAYVRVIVAVPAALDDTNDAGHKALHWNSGERFMPEGNFSSTNSTNSAFDDITVKSGGTAVVKGVSCNLYIFTYATPLAGGQITDAAAFTGFYLDEDANVVDGHILLDGVDTGFTQENVVIHVTAQAVQAHGFKDAAEAFSAAGAPANPWPDADH